ncbi:MAG TPA: NAD(P)H-dependent oxidoreductase subunit E [Thermodesulfovibrionales bacterium]|nr:NAD(P)H-dependent oxidoreductase subunit E [Thermodesulfovibrionales bacterium]
MKGKILMVDDEEIVLKSCERILRPEGYEVKGVTSGRAALEVLGGEHFDLIITDIKMPEMDGLEFMREVRKKAQDINIVVITGYPSQESISEALSLRIIDYLPKPFSPTLLLEVVAKGVEFRQKGVTPEPVVEEYTGETAEKMEGIIRRYRNKPGSLIPVLQEAQELIGYLPPVVQKHIARGLRVPVSEVHGVVSFYSFFTMKPKGRHNVKVCLGTACYVKGAEEIANKMKEGLGVEVGGITGDRKFSLESVRCLGACGLAPVVVVDKDTHGSVNPVKAMELLKQYE